MKIRLALVWASAAALAVSFNVQAQTVWRCGEGGRTYSETPCPGGRPVKASDPRSAAEVQAAREGVTGSQNLAARMRKERLAEEQRNLAANAGAANVGPTRAAAQPPEKVKPKSKTTDPRRQPQKVAAGDGTWRAAAAGSRRKKD